MCNWAASLNKNDDAQAHRKRVRRGTQRKKKSFRTDEKWMRESVVENPGKAPPEVVIGPVGWSGDVPTRAKGDDCPWLQ